jgi:hypothetical protein
VTPATAGQASITGASASVRVNHGTAAAPNATTLAVLAMLDAVLAVRRSALRGLVITLR